jgi:hypothetical protein
MHDHIARRHRVPLAVRAHRAAAARDEEELPLCGVIVIRTERFARRELLDREIERMAAVELILILRGTERE